MERSETTGEDRWLERETDARGTRLRGGRAGATGLGDEQRPLRTSVDRIGFQLARDGKGAMKALLRFEPHLIGPEGVLRKPEVRENVPELSPAGGQRELEPG